MHIPDEDFIPEGLEFREEYMRSALSMYERARKTLLWKKWIYGSLGASVVLVSAILLLNNREVKEKDLAISPTITHEITNAASTPQVPASTSSNLDHSSNNPTIPATAETTSSPKNEILESTPEQSTSYTNGKFFTIPAQNKTYTSVISGNHGKVKSGSESQTTISKAGNLTTETPTVKITDASENPNNPEHLASPGTTDENNSDVYTDRILTPISMLSTRAGTFYFGEETLRRAGMTPLPVSKWTPYVSLGLNPFTRYGLNYSQLHLNPAIGAGIQYNVCRGSRLSAGIEYYSITDLSHPFAINNSEYGQGSIKTQTTIFTHTLHYAGIHLQHITPLGKRHAVLLGYRGSYLINGQNEISTSSTQNSEALAGSTSKATGYIAGFRNFNHALSLGYEYKVGANKNLGINYSYGLSDITRDAYFGSRFDRNSMIGVYLKMNIR